MTTLQFRGHPACSCLVTWLPRFEAELLETDVIDEPLHIAQLIGLAKDSAKVHSTGGAADLWETDPRVSLTARRMGAVSWPRVTGSFADNQHTHLVLIGCTHLHPQGVAQIKEAYAGGDGLLGDVPDDSVLHAALWPKRTWREGIAWQQAQSLRRKRIAKLALVRERREKWRRWSRRATANIERLKSLI
jgi:hypothetical protein